jgi:hypothetical protein
VTVRRLNDVSHVVRRRLAPEDLMLLSAAKTMAHVLREPRYCRVKNQDTMTNITSVGILTVISRQSGHSTQTSA